MAAQQGEQLADELPAIGYSDGYAGAGRRAWRQKGEPSRRVEQILGYERDRIRLIF